jgi:putative ABC transport system substrate-binding protein
MKRRDLITALLVAVTTAHAQAQQTGKVYRMGMAHPSHRVADLSETGAIPFYRAFFRELRRLGYVEGQNLLVERYSGEGRTQQFAELVRNVIRSSPDVIYTVGFGLVFEFKATTTIPIVCVADDPVAYGIVPSLARPGGNITGVSGDAGLEILGKRIELLREAIPAMSKIGYLASRANWETFVGAAMREGAHRAGIFVVGSPLNAPFTEAEYRRVLTSMAQEGADVLFVDTEAVHLTNRRLIVELAEKARLPSIYGFRDFVEAGGLMAYAIDWPDMGRHAAGQIDQILRGTKPGEIPFYQPTKFELVINLKTAKTLGIEMPASLLAQADEVIE